MSRSTRSTRLTQAHYRDNGITYEELYQRLTAERPTHVDAIVRTNRHVEVVPMGLRPTPDGDEAMDVGLFFKTGPAIPELDGEVSAITDFTHGQIAARTGIDKKYYDRMRWKQPDLLIRNLETWWNAEPDERLVRLVTPARVEEGQLVMGDLTARAWLSDRYRPLDNLDFVMTVLEAADALGAKIWSCHLDDERVYLKLVSDDLVADLGKDDILQAGIIVKNSEVGDGRVLVQPFCLRRICWNGLIGTESFAQVHLGAQNEIGILKQDTLEADARSVWLQVRDWTTATFEGVFLERRVAEFKAAQGVPVDVPARRAVANVVRSYGLPGGDGEGILERYLRNDDPSHFGLVNAITQFAHEGQRDFRRQVELEALGGKLLQVPAKDFRHMIHTQLTDEQVTKAVNAA